MPFFSVIIPLYNKAPYVRKAVESVLAQTFVDWELIVVDDGSTDDGGKQVATLCDSRIRMIRQENCGVSVARNNGVAVAQGDYICFLDADDWWCDGYLESMQGLIARHPDAGLYSTAYLLVKNGRQRQAPIGVAADFAEGAIDYCAVYAQTLCMPVITGAACVPRHVFDEQGGFRRALTLGEDFDLWLRIAQNHTVVLLNRALVYYNQDADPRHRAIRRLHDPAHHVLWNLPEMEAHATKNTSYKQLIDSLRVYGLYPYYLSRRYRKAARQELDKVDWQRQPKAWRRRYNTPVALLQIRELLLRTAAGIKGYLLQH